VGLNILDGLGSLPVETVFSFLSYWSSSAHYYGKITFFDGNITYITISKCQSFPKFSRHRWLRSPHYIKDCFFCGTNTSTDQYLIDVIYKEKPPYRVIDTPLTNIELSNFYRIDRSNWKPLCHFKFRMGECCKRNHFLLTYESLLKLLIYQIDLFFLKKFDIGVVRICISFFYG